MLNYNMSENLIKVIASFFVINIFVVDYNNDNIEVYPNISNFDK